MRKTLILFLLLWGSVVSYAQTADFTYYKSLGLVQYYEKNFLQAIFNLQKAATLKPADRDVTSFLKMCYDSVGSKDLAGKMRMKMEKFNASPNDNRPVIKPAMASDEPPQGSASSQRKNLTRPKVSPATEVANDLRQLGDYFMERESYDSAAICYDHYARSYPRDTSVLYYLATSQYFIKQYDNAIRNFEISIAKEPQRAELYNWVGVCELLSGNYISARDNFKQCIRLDNDYSLAYFNLGKTQYELEDYGSAAKNLEKAQESMQNDPDIIKMLADIYYNMSKWNKSKTLYEALYTLNKKSERANYRLGDIYVRLGQWDKAVAYLSNFLSLVPNNVEAEKKIGIAYFNLEKYTFAIDNFEKAAKTVWDDKELMLFTAIASNKLGNYDKAIDYANRAITLDKNYTRAYYQLANAYKVLKNKKLAKENLAKAQDLEMNAVSITPDTR
jgi:tetratricopeptide (TPR) repeat protein